MTSPSAIVALHDIGQRIRDRTVLVQGLLAPLVLASIMGVAFGGGASDPLAIAIADSDHSATSERIVSGDLRPAADANRAVVIERDEATARAAVQAGDVDAAIIIPSGFGSGAEPLVVLGHRERPIAASAAESVARLIGAELAGVSISDARITEDPVLASSNPVGYFGPAMAILFLYFSVGAGARSLLAERRQGTLARMRVAPVPFRAVVIGKLTAIFVVALASMLALWAATVLLFDASWGSVVGVLVLSTATIVAVAGIAALIAAWATNEESADAATGIVAFLLAMFGGNFFPPGALPDLFERASRLTPNGASLQAFARLSIDDAGLSALVPALLVLLAIGAVCGTWGFMRLTARVTDR